MAQQKARLFSVTFLGIVLGVSSAWAIPAFARKYGTSCTTCHVQYPRLNAVGESFRLKGFSFPEGGVVAKEEPVSLGQPAYKKLWPNALWPSDLPGVPPISVLDTFDTNFHLKGRNKGGQTDSPTTFSFPGEVNIVTATRLGDDISLFGDIQLQDGQAVGLGQTWFQFSDIFSKNYLLNAKVGKLDPREFGLYTANDEITLATDGYLYEDWTIDYDNLGFGTKNDWTMSKERAGVEFFGFTPRFKYEAGVLEGAGITHSSKDVFGSLAYKYGGLGFDGSGGSAQTSDFWRDDSVTVALFGYSGDALIKDAASVRKNDRFWRFGPGVRVMVARLEANTGYVLGKNDDPYGTLTTKSVDSRAWHVEGSYILFPWLIGTARYESLRIDTPQAVIDAGGVDQDRDRYILSLSALIRANVKAVLEGRFYTKDKRFKNSTVKGSNHEDNQLMLRFQIAF